MTTAPDTILELEDVHTFYGTIEALKGISLTVRDERDRDADRVERRWQVDDAALDQRPQPAAARDDSRSWARTSRSTPAHAIVRKGISQSPEGRKLFPRMTVTENLEMGAFQRRDKQGIQEDMDHVFQLFPRLAERRSQKAGTMSGGEQQMCAIGRAMMAKPRLLMLDEPSMGLAPIFVDRIFETIVEINKEGTPILLVEQNALMALDVADRGYVLQTGTIALEGDAKELQQNEDVRKAYLGVE